jgi:ComF family protein
MLIPAEPTGQPPWSDVRSLVSAGLTRVIDLVMPPQCAVCAAPLERAAALCPRCWARIDFIEPPYCARLGLPFAYDLGPGALSAAALASDHPFDRVRSVALYHGPARDLVTALKFGARVSHAPMMAAWMARAGAELLEDTDLVVPVPMHWLRLAARRHNQAALLARHIAARAGRGFAPGLLARRRRTRPQTGLSAAARARNLTGAIALARPGEVRGAAILVVDDVFTTGATAAACARALKRAGARRVDVLTFARVAGEGENAIFGG